ncbi:MAG: hypothetical protein MJ119_03700 [Lachnospiraceae bacterium]|nr:hypothetical protein [Lachnospiraceae bacterium]
MRKFICITLVVTLALSLVACGRNSRDSKGDELAGLVDPVYADEDSGEDIIDTEEPGDDSDDSDEVEENVSELKTVDYPEVYLGYVYDNSYEDSDGLYRSYATMTAPIVSLSDEAALIYPELQEELARLSEKWIDYGRTTFNILDEYSRDENEPFAEEWKEYSDERTVFIKRSDREVLSFVAEEKSCYGPDDVEFDYETVNFKTETGERILLTDLVTDVKTFADRVYNIVVSMHPEADTGKVREMVDIFAGSDTFGNRMTVENDKVVIYFSDGDFGCGAFSVPLSYAENSDIFSGEYTSNANATYIYDGVLAGDNFVDVNSDGKPDIVRIDYETDEYENVISYSIKVNGIDLYGFTADEFNMVFSLKPYFVHTSNGTYLYLEHQEIDDYNEFAIFSLGESSVSLTHTTGLTPHGNFVDRVYADGEEHFLWRAFSNGEVMQLGERTDLLGTQDLIAEYTVGPDGIPVMNGGYYTFSVNFELVFNMDIEADVVDEDGNVISHSAEIHYGDICHPYRTDNSTYVDVKMSDGRIVRFKFGTNPSGWGYMLNDISQDDIFQSIMYAG